MAAGVDFSPKRMLAVLCVMSFLASIALVPVTLFSPVIMESIVQHVHPEFDPSQVKSKVQVIKSGIAAATAVLSFFFVPIFGSLSDTYGRKKILVATTSCAILNTMCFMAAYHFNQIALLYTGPVFSFVETAHIAVMSAYVADLTATSERKNKPILFSLLMSSLSFGMLLANLFFGNLYSNKIWQSLYISLGSRVIEWLVLVIFIRNHPDVERKVLKFSKNPFQAIVTIVATRDKLLMCLMGIQFIGALGLSDELSAGFLYAQDRFNWGTQKYGNLTASMLGVTIFCQLPLLWVVSRRLKEKYMIMFAYFYGSIIHFLLGVGYESWMYISLRVAEGVSLVSFPAMQAVYSIAAPADQLGTIYAAMSAISSLASFFGSLAFGDYFAYCLDKFPSKETLTFPSLTYIGNIYLIGGCLALINAIFATVVFHKLFKTRQIKQKEKVTVTVEERPLIDPSTNSINGDYA